jgi:processive 1,2-diacylglycerol beta-glucosyltransferase
VVVTDLRVHPLWINKSTDIYIVAMEETKKDLIKAGIEKERIKCGFLPLRKGFLKDIPEDDIFNRFSLEKKPTLLFISSLRGNFPFLIKTIPIFKNKFNIFVICGKNKRLSKILKKIKCRNLRFFSSYENMWELISVADIVITKPGGLTIFEGMYKKKPFIFTHYIYGQEKENMDLLITYGIGKFAKNKEEFLKWIKYFLENCKIIEKNYPIDFKDIRELEEAIWRS